MRPCLRCIKSKFCRLPIISALVFVIRSFHGSSHARTGRQPAFAFRQRSRRPRRLGSRRQGGCGLSRHAVDRDAGRNCHLPGSLCRVVGQREGLAGSRHRCRLRRLARLLLHEACRHERRFRRTDDADPDRCQRRSGDRHCRRRRPVVLTERTGFPLLGAFCACAGIRTGRFAGSLRDDARRLCAVRAVPGAGHPAHDDAYQSRQVTGHRWRARAAHRCRFPQGPGALRDGPGQRRQAHSADVPARPRPARTGRDLAAEFHRAGQRPPRRLHHFRSGLYARQGSLPGRTGVEARLLLPGTVREVP